MLNTNTIQKSKEVRWISKIEYKKYSRRTLGFSVTERGIPLSYRLDVDKKCRNVKPKLFCYMYLVQLYIFLLIVEMM